MQWNQSTMYDQRVRFILEVQQRTFSFAESCKRYGISRTAGYLWWKRSPAEGFEELHDRSHAITDPFVEHIVDPRQRYGWGLRKIRKLTAEKFGLPAVIRSDNGTPFASIGLARLTRLSAWWIQFGIRPETIEPGKPQQNGRYE